MMHDAALTHSRTHSVDDDILCNQRSESESELTLREPGKDVLSMFYQHDDDLFDTQLEIN